MFHSIIFGYFKLWILEEVLEWRSELDGGMRIR